MTLGAHERSELAKQSHKLLTLCDSSFVGMTKAVNSRIKPDNLNPSPDGRGILLYHKPFQKKN